MAVYKYYAPRKYNIEALRNEYFWFSKRMYQNDPFDMYVEIIDRFSKFKQCLIDLGYDHDKYTELVNKFATCSFAKSGTNKHLWALYADSYRGWCLEFEETDKMVIGTFDKRLYGMTYIGEMPDLNNFETHIPHYDNPSECTPINGLLCDIKNKGGERLFHYLLCIKEKNTWEIEEEKRMILSRTFLLANCISENAAGYKVSWAPNILRRIIVGHNISKRKLHSLQRIAHDKGIELWRTKIGDPTTFSIEIERFF